FGAHGTVDEGFHVCGEAPMAADRDSGHVSSRYTFWRRSSRSAVTFPALPRAARKSATDRTTRSEPYVMPVSSAVVARAQARSIWRRAASVRACSMSLTACCLADRWAFAARLSDASAAFQRPSLASAV